MKEMRDCCVCGSLHPVEELTEFDDSYLCASCLHTETTRCQRCGERIWTDDDAGDEYTHLCQTCYDQHYTTCVRCHCVVHLDDVYYEDDNDYDALCYDCFQRRGRKYIHDYSYKPEPIFYGSKKSDALFMGIELEVEGAGTDPDKAMQILDAANQREPMIYIKRDGSLEAGLEIVSYPATLDYHLNEFPWGKILKKTRDLGYVSHTSKNCGLHVHLNRRYFGATEVEQEDAIARLLFLFEMYWNELLRFSRRSQNSCRQWCDRYGLRSHPKEVLDHAKKSFRGERYTAVNLCNANTVEIRLWRGSLRDLTFRAALMMTAKLAEIARCLSDDEVRSLSWSAMVSGFTEPEIITYLKEKRLYVSDPVDTEREV